jgi:hypothetical protein
MTPVRFGTGIVTKRGVGFVNLNNLCIGWQWEKGGIWLVMVRGPRFGWTVPNHQRGERNGGVESSQPANTSVFCRHGWTTTGPISPTTYLHSRTTKLIMLGNHILIPLQMTLLSSGVVAIGSRAPIRMQRMFLQGWLGRHLSGCVLDRRFVHSCIYSLYLFREVLVQVRGFKRDGGRVTEMDHDNSGRPRFDSTRESIPVGFWRIE